MLTSFKCLKTNEQILRYFFQIGHVHGEGKLLKYFKWIFKGNITSKFRVMLVWRTHC